MDNSVANNSNSNTSNIENKPRKIIQCMFDFKLFFKRKSHLYFPGAICFPQYFAFSIFSVFKNLYYSQSEYVKTLCYAYLDILPTIVQRIYGSDYEIIIDKNKLFAMADKIKNNLYEDDSNDFTLLETYLRDNTSVINYRKALLENVLTYHNFETVNQLIDHLHDVQCCSTKENISLIEEEEEEEVESEELEAEGKEEKKPTEDKEGKKGVEEEEEERVKAAANVRKGKKRKIGPKNRNREKATAQTPVMRLKRKKNEKKIRYPASDHYIPMTMTDKRPNNVIQDGMVDVAYTTKAWGPIYWNVIHTLGEERVAAIDDDDDDGQIKNPGEKKVMETRKEIRPSEKKHNEEENRYDYEDDRKNCLLDYINVLPFTLPCLTCTHNYIDKMEIFQGMIREFCETHPPGNGKDFCVKKLYEKIHDVISYHTYPFISTSTST